MGSKLVRLIILACAISYPTALGQETLPSGEERARIVANIQQKYPDLPGELAGYLADQRNAFTRELRCEVYDWFAAAPAGVAAETANRASSFANACVMSQGDLTPEVAAAKLQDKAYAVEAADGVVTVYARGDHMVYACCAPQVELLRLGDSEFWVRRIRMNHFDQAFTSVMVIDPQKIDPKSYENRFVWRGSEAPVPYREIPFPALKGRVESGVIDSVVLGEKRKVGVYLPPGWTKDTTWPVAFVGDLGHGNFYPMVEALIEDGLIEPIILIGVGSGWEAKVDADPAQAANHPQMRNSEYMPGYADGEAFDRHLSYMADEVTAWATENYNASTSREKRVIAGFSGGGTMALFTGLRRPDVFGYSIPMSPSWAAPTGSDLAYGKRAVFHMSGGVYEPDFHVNVKRFERMMHEAGFDILAEYPVSGHFPDHWRHVFANALIRFFPKRPAR